MVPAQSMAAAAPAGAATDGGGGPPSRVTWGGGARAASRGGPERGCDWSTPITPPNPPLPPRPAAPSRVPSGAAEGEPQQRSGLCSGRAGASSAAGSLLGRRGRSCEEEGRGSAPAEALRRVSLAKGVSASCGARRREEEGCGAMGPPAEQPQARSCGRLLLLIAGSPQTRKVRHATRVHSYFKTLLMLLQPRSNEVPQLMAVTRQKPL
ncbi:uncharacterized protein LOC128798305 [Vidua chalybeata]|uniref:uncharacterized protein LOC128798305 n=1 Tax=Vidua chalybeata TaxID=81927 RepID=UPI0023A7E36D|nr:uncharacterized protein LOC128798305 [Vidua chalybeata]